MPKGGRSCGAICYAPPVHRTYKIIFTISHLGYSSGLPLGLAVGIICIIHCYESSGNIGKSLNLSLSPCPEPAPSPTCVYTARTARGLPGSLPNSPAAGVRVRLGRAPRGDTGEVRGGAVGSR